MLWRCPMSNKNICHAALVIFSIGQQSGSAANPTFLFVSKSLLTDSQLCCVHNMKQPFSIFMKNTNTNTWRVSGHLFSQQSYDSQRLNKVTFWIIRLILTLSFEMSQCFIPLDRSHIHKAEHKYIKHISRLALCKSARTWPITCRVWKYQMISVFSVNGANGPVLSAWPLCTSISCTVMFPAHSLLFT